MTPAETHTAVLAGLAGLEALHVTATTARWATVDLRRIRVDAHPDGSPLAAPSVLAITEDHDLVLQLRNSAGPVLAGRRRIIERHAPIDYGVMGACCRDPQHTGSAGPSWPCDDYRDAAADLLPAEPQETRS